jgi:hypothetical protein
MSTATTERERLAPLCRGERPSFVSLRDARKDFSSYLRSRNGAELPVAELPGAPPTAHGSAAFPHDDKLYLQVCEAYTAVQSCPCTCRVQVGLGVRPERVTRRRANDRRNRQTGTPE